MDLAGYIELLRDKNSLSFSDLERASDIDRAYIWHLAKGTKTAPSEAALEKLADAFGLNERPRQVLHLLAQQSLDDALFSVMLKHTEIPWDELRNVSGVSNRGTRPTTEEAWLNLLEHIRELFKV